MTKAFLKTKLPPHLRRPKRQLHGNPSQDAGARDPLLEPSGFMTANLSLQTKDSNTARTGAQNW